MGARRIGIELASADLLQDCLRHDRASGIVRTDEEHVKRRLHGSFLIDVVREKPCQIAAEIRPAGTAGLCQEAQEFPQTDEAHGLDDVAALSRRTNEAHLFERPQVEGERRRRYLERGRDFAGRHPRRPMRRQEANEVEPRLLS